MKTYVTWVEVKPRSPPNSKRFKQGRTGYHRAIRAEQQAEKIQKEIENTRLEQEILSDIADLMEMLEEE